MGTLRKISFREENALLRKEIEELKRQIQLREIALNSTKVLIRITDLDGIVKYVNSAHSTILGYTEEDRIGRSSFEVVHPEDIDRVMKYFFWFAAHPELDETSIIEYRMQHKKGHYLWARAEGRYARKDGKPYLAVITVWDITESKNMQDQLHALAERLHTIREEERTLISREIHDEFGQALTSLKFDLALLARHLPAQEKEAHEKAKKMLQYIDSTIQLIRRISTELRPPILDDFGLKAAIEWQAEDFQNKTGIKCRLKSDLDEDIDLGENKSISVFRIFQEALTNVARHAHATQVVVDFHKKKKGLVMQIKDNGRGIHESEIVDKTSLGITGMKERAFALGATFEIKSKPGKGTLIHFSLPFA